MSMLVRKGTMLHRASSARRYSRRYSTASRDRERASSLVPLHKPNAPSVSPRSNRPSVSSVTTTSTTLTPPDADSRRSSNTVSQISVDDRKCLYDDVESGGAIRGANYGSIVYQMRDASDEATGCVDFVVRALGILFNTVFFSGLLLLFATMPILMVVMGVKYLRNCPTEPHVPIYLLVGGCFGLIRLLLLMWRQSRSRRHYGHFEESLLLSTHHSEVAGAIMCARVMETLLSFFLLIWFVAGNYWTLMIFQPHYTAPHLEPRNWCDRTLYLFALGQIGATYAILACFVVFSCCLGIGHLLTAIF